MTAQLTPGDVSAADLDDVEWLKVTSESLLGDAVTFWHVGVGETGALVKKYDEHGDELKHGMNVSECVTALNNNVDSSAAAEVVDIQLVDAEAVPVEV